MPSVSGGESVAANPLDLYPEVSVDAVRARLAYRQRHSGKTCAKCGRVLPLSAFTTDSRKPDGLDKRCNQCKAKAARSRRTPAPTV